MYKFLSSTLVTPAIGRGKVWWSVYLWRTEGSRIASESSNLAVGFYPTLALRIRYKLAGRTHTPSYEDFLCFPSVHMGLFMLIHMYPVSFKSSRSFLGKERHLPRYFLKHFHLDSSLSISLDLRGGSTDRHCVHPSTPPSKTGNSSPTTHLLSNPLKYHSVLRGGSKDRRCVHPLTPPNKTVY